MIRVVVLELSEHRDDHRKSLGSALSRKSRAVNSAFVRRAGKSFSLIASREPDTEFSLFGTHTIRCLLVLRKTMRGKLAQVEATSSAQKQPGTGKSLARGCEHKSHCEESEKKRFSGREIARKQ